MQKLNLIVIGLFIYCALIANSTGAETERLAQQVYGPLKSGDILWDIAGKVQLTDTSITRYQVMVALFKANAQAFRVPCNIHSLLKVGQTLQIPSLVEMRATTHAEAIALFDQQKTIWKHRRTQTIICPADKNKEADKEEKPAVQKKIVPVVKTADKTLVKKPIPSPQQPITVVAESPAETKNPPTFLKTAFPLPTSAIVSLSIIASLFVLALFIGWLLHKYVPQKEQTQNNDYKKHDFTDEIGSSEPLDNIEDDLSQARTCLAQGDTQTAKAHLTNILNGGQPDQQKEAYQLLEITMQMSTLELQVVQSKKIVSLKDDEMASQTLAETETYLPVSQYLPKDEEKLSEFVGKIFKFIDHELNAQGKLLAAYNKMDKKSDLDVEDYHLMEQEHDTTHENPQKRSRERKPTRYL